MNIAIVAFDHFTDLDVFLPWDLLNRVRVDLHKEDWAVHLVGADATHRSISGLQTPMTSALESIEFADAVLFGSGSKGVLPLLKDDKYMGTLRSLLNPDRQMIGAMCSGALFLGALGFLEGKRATTYPTQKQRLKDYGVTVVDEPFVEVGNIATAAGCLAGVDLSKWVIQRLAGDGVSTAVMASVEPVGIRPTVAQ